EDLAVAYADWLARTTGKKYRLATDDELEYACIAGGTMPAWVQTESRAAPDASADIAELNAWGFMDLPDTVAEFTAGDSKNLPGAWERSDLSGARIRIVRVPEGNKPATNASAASPGRTPETPSSHPSAISPGKS